MNACKMHRFLVRNALRQIAAQTDTLSKLPSPLMQTTGNSQTACLLSKNKSNLPYNFSARAISIFGSDSRKNRWSKAVSEAEKLVGYPTSFMSLRCLLSDELANVALQVRKLVGTKHPLVQTAKNFVYDGPHSIQTRGLVVLLVSKAAGPGEALKDLSTDQVSSSGIHASQRALAEIVEMIHTAFLVHEGVVNLQEVSPEDGSIKDMDFGNKMAVLSGDFLLATACMGLAKLKSPGTVETISETITHMTRGAFASIHAQSKDLSIDDWKDYVFLWSGSLIGQSSRAALQLANHTQELCDAAFEFGKNLAWAKQLHQDVTKLREKSTEALHPIYAPVILHNELSGSRDILSTKTDPQEIYNTIQESQAMESGIAMNNSFTDAALTALDKFPESDAKNSLRKITKALKL